MSHHIDIYLRRLGYYIHSCVKMRYKGAYRPSYLLGRFCTKIVYRLGIHTDLCYLDPESNEWDPLNQDFLNRLSARKYVSMSHERRLEIPTTSTCCFLQSDSMTASDFTKESRLSLDAFKDAFNYVNGPENEAASTKATRKYTSALEAGMPGLMSLNELVANEDLLGQWRLRLGDIMVTLEVNPCSVKIRLVPSDDPFLRT